MSRWFEIRVAVSPEGADALSNFLMEQGSCGLESCGSDEVGRADETVVLRAYFERREDRTAEELFTIVRRYVDALGALKAVVQAQVSVHDVEEADWEAGWRAHFGIVRVGKRIVVRPSWVPYEAQPDEAPYASKIVLVIDPKMAFGVGTHPTTQLCLMALEERVKSGDAILDVGTGTGILAIAAAKLGAKRVVGVDVDEDAVRNARENVRLNGVEDRVRIEQGTMNEVVGDSVAYGCRFSRSRFQASKFDVIAANIRFDVLSSMVESIGRALTPDGIALFSGLLVHEERAFADRLSEAGFRVSGTDRIGEWIAFRAKREG